MLLHASLLRCSAAALALLTLGPGRGVDAWRIVYNEDTCFAQVTGEQEAADPAAPLICYKYDGKAQGSNTCSMAGWGTTSFSSETCAAGEDVCFRRVKFFRVKKYWEHYGGCGAPDEDRPQDSEGYDLTNCTTSYCNVGDLNPNEGSIGVGWVVFWCVVLALCCAFCYNGPYKDRVREKQNASKSGEGEGDDDKDAGQG